MKSIEFAEKQLNHKMIITKQESSAIQPGKLADEALNTKIDSSLINCIIKNKDEQKNCYSQKKID